MSDAINHVGGSGKTIREATGERRSTAVGPTKFWQTNTSSDNDYTSCVDLAGLTPTPGCLGDCAIPAAPVTSAGRQSSAILEREDDR